MGPSSINGPPASKTAYALERLRKEIADGVIRPGESLRQADIAKRFGISPTPVREALRLLEAEGSISYAPHRGATVAELSDERVHDLYLLRATTEGLATRLAAQRRSEDQLREIRTMHEELVAATRMPDSDHQQLAAWNRELHMLICSAGSALITSHVMPLWRMFPTRSTMWKEPDLVNRFLKQHDDIVAAVADADDEAAYALMADHIMTAAEHRLRH